MNLITYGKLDKKKFRINTIKQRNALYYIVLYINFYKTWKRKE